MVSFRFDAAAFAFAITLVSLPAYAQETFPFGLEMTLEAPPMAGTKRRPSLEIGDAGETRVELWCKGGKGQFSVAGDTILFLPGAIEDRGCAPALAQADDALLATLANVATWRRRGDVVTLNGGARPLQFRINSN